VAKLREGVRMGVKEGLELVDRFLAEGRKYMDRGDPVQASEKFYKVVEECVKLLAEKENLPEHEEFRREGRFWSRLLARSASALAAKLHRKRIEDAWTRAFNLHIWGFHEKALEVEHVKPSIAYMEWLVNYTKER